MLKSVHVDDVDASTFADRWSKNLVGTDEIPTLAGFNLGVAEYHATDFEDDNIQEHDDQEALFVLSGEGEIQIGDAVYPARPGAAFYIPAHTPHAARRTGEAPLRLIYTHGAV
ncbi:MAG: cupin domain-containing protein [Candidatus Latescibacteria bacterium]|jgi:mannose-6-phosphate isomerase-like protein (cupin superfamily)|nr:cupin domain-containing protein [Candidatus Latescibacterota bacterium]